MVKDEKSTLPTFTASCLNNPFKLKGRPRNIHTMQGEFPNDVLKSANGGPNNHNDAKTAGKSNVSKIMKLIPGLCQIKKHPPETPLREPNIRSSHNKNQLNDEGILIDICSPSKTVISGKLTSQKICGTKGLRQQRTKKKAPVNPRVFMFSTNQPRLNIHNSSLNVKVSGPMYNVLAKMMESNIKKVVTLSGAGMSTSAGIPDFRSPNSGIYDRLREYNLPYVQAIFERKYFDKNPKPLFALLREMLAEDYKPTVAHYFVKLLEEKGLLLRHITQNVDGLERLAGVSQNKVVEAHGSVYSSRCLKCKTEYDLQWLRDRLVIQGKAIPQCQDPHCMGMVRPNIVLFGETLNPRFIPSVKKDIPECDLLIIIGTSLVVEPFASTAKKVPRNCPRIIVNNIPVGEHLGIVYEGSSDFNRKKNTSVLRDIFVQGSCDEGVMHLVKLFKWESDFEALIHRCEPGIIPPQHAALRIKDENTTGERPNEANDKKPAQTKHDKDKKQSNINPKSGKATEKEARTSITNRAKNMWHCIKSQLMRPDPQANN